MDPQVNIISKFKLKKGNVNNLEKFEKVQLIILDPKSSDLIMSRVK